MAASGRSALVAARGARARRSRGRRALRHGSRPPHRGLAGRRRARDERVAGTSIRGRPSVGARRRHRRGARRRGRGEGDRDVRALQAWPPHAQRREPRRARARRRHRRSCLARDARRQRAAAARAGGPRCARSWRDRPALTRQSAGHVAVVAGSPGKVGAPQLVGARRAARRGGSRHHRDVARRGDRHRDARARGDDGAHRSVGHRREPRRDPARKARGRHRPGTRASATTRA